MGRMENKTRTGDDGASEAQLITLADAAGRLGLEPAECRRLINRGEFCGVYRLTRNRILVDPDELERWLAARRVEPTRPESVSIRRPGFAEERSALRAQRRA